MKKILSLITIVSIFAGMMNTSYAVKEQPYSYILPMEYTDIETDNCANVIIARDKSGNCAVYNYDGEKVSENYDYIKRFKYDVTLAKRNGINYFINYQGTVVGSTDKTVLYYNADNFSSVLNEENEILTKEIDQLNKTIDELVSSNSWKITKPFRRLRLLFK